MTREEAIDLLKDYINYDTDTPDYYDMEEACKIALKALEQQPCEDCISRQEAIDAMFGLCSEGENPHIDAIADTIERLPSVTPKQKVGKWIKVDNEEPLAYDCSECDAMVSKKYNYCLNCGAKMEIEK